MTKRCIILSQGPVPTPEHDKVEGGGLRCWGLAKGMLANNPDLQVTVAYHESYAKPKPTKKHQGIEITTWSQQRIPELISGYDTVVVSYCMAELSVITADTIRPDQQLVLDCYVPIYVEVSARNSDDMDREYHAFHGDVGRWAHVLRRGDVFLCANEPQKAYYRGVLSAVGRINPATYGQDLIMVVPYGIEREEPKAQTKPITKLIGKDAGNAKKIMWFGGIYPWFDLRNLVDAIVLLNKTLPARLVIVGAKNPFNKHPDFLRKYDELIEYIDSKPESHKEVLVQDWVEFETRADWYLDSDLVVLVNKEGEENALAWRTRLVDYLWADLPIITNGGDPLSEYLLSHDAAERFSGLSAEQIAADLRRTLEDSSRLKAMRKRMAEVKGRFYWDVATKELAVRIEKHDRARDLQLYGSQNVLPGGTSRASKVRRILSKARMMPAYTRKHGMRSTYLVIRTKVNNRLKRYKKPRGPQVIMIAHQMDLSGAPYVFLELLRDLKEQAKQKLPIEFHTFNPTHRNNILALNKLGIKPNLHLSKDITLDFVKGDVVILNTVAHTSMLKESIFQALDNDTVGMLAWFVHEDEPEYIFSAGEAKRIKNLLEKDKIVMYIPAEKNARNYQQFFEHTKNIRKQPYRHITPKRFQKVRGAEEFDKLSFILPGTVNDSRKGQLPIFYALHEFFDTYYKPNKADYRDFELVFVGVEDDFASRQLLNHAAKLFGKRFKHYGRVSHERSSELIVQSNVTLCYSMRECLPLFVFEGMAAGHPLLRNDASGIDEQLFDGKNGYFLDSADYNQVVETFEKVLNTKKTTNKQLADMSAYSNKVAMEWSHKTFDAMIDDILGKFRA